MRILQVSSEVHPFSKTGGLADMVSALAKSLARAGHIVGLVTPMYQGIAERHPQIQKLEWDLTLPLGSDWVSGEVWTLSPERNLTIYFIKQPGFFHRAGLYSDGEMDYPDNAERFIFFAKAASHLARHLPWKPELVHCHDWQTGLIPLFIRHESAHEDWKNPPLSCLTIHNLAYQGNFLKPQWPLTNLPEDYFHPEGVEFYGGFNCLKSGIAFSNVITTVSPRYAREVTTEAYGCGLDGILRRRHEVLFGILNGVDYDEWNTINNPFLKNSYSLKNLEGKRDEKLAFQQEMGLPIREDVPVFGSITRLVEQKGVDILLGALEEMLSADMQFVLLGSGSLPYEKGVARLAKRYPHKVGAKIGFDMGLSHRIEAASDFYLMPSRFEPCGLNQMYSLHYGAIPIVRVTGGLDDSVVDISEDMEKANGIKFSEYSVRALAKSIRKALVLFKDPELVQHYRMNGMSRDFSWEHTAKEYLSVYRSALQKRTG